MSDPDALARNASLGNSEDPFASASPGIGPSAPLFPHILGGVLAAVVLAWSPWGSPSTSLRERVLLAGAALLLPIIVIRWNHLRRNGSAGRLPVAGVAVAGSLAVWSVAGGLILAMSGQAPLSLSLFGWFGRGMGALALVAAAILLAGGAVLDRAEARITLAWFSCAAAVSGLVTLLQAVGIDVAGSRVDGEAPGLLGNADFASAVYAIALVLTITAALTQSGRVRWLAVGLSVVLLAAMALSGPLQGPLALVAGLFVTGIALWARWRPAGRYAGLLSRVLVVLMGILLVAGGVIVVLVRTTETVQTRILLWQTAVTAMGQRPLWGSGPDGFARVFGAARPEAFLDLRPPEYHASAVHDVPLQLGATLGIPGPLLWLALVALVGVALVLGVRRSASHIVVTAAVAGAVTAYVAQSLVSIDMLALLAVGWTLFGCALALSRTPTPPRLPPVSANNGAHYGRLREANGGWVNWGWVIGGVLAVAVALLTTPTFLADARSMHPSDPAAMLASPDTPCARREPLAQDLLRSQGAAAALPVIAQAAALDGDCLGVQQVLVEAALNADDPALAASVAQQIIDRDPYNTPAWIALAIATATSDPARAQSALARAEQLAAHTPKRYRYELDQVRQLLEGPPQG